MSKKTMRIVAILALITMIFGILATIIAPLF